MLSGVTEQYKSLAKDEDNIWSDIPMLAVVTGNHGIGNYTRLRCIVKSSKNEQHAKSLTFADDTIKPACFYYSYYRLREG